MKDPTPLEIVGAAIGALLLFGAFAYLLLWCTPDDDYGAPAPTSMQQ